MGKDINIGVRVEKDLEKRLDAICEEYDVDRSTVIRWMLRYGLSAVETRGIGTIIESTDAGSDGGEAPADD